MEIRASSGSVRIVGVLEDATKSPPIGSDQNISQIIICKLMIFDYNLDTQFAKCIDLFGHSFLKAPISPH